MEAMMRGDQFSDALTGNFGDHEGTGTKDASKQPETDDSHNKLIGLLSVKTAQRPDPEVPSKARRRKFSAEYKQMVLEEADACTDIPGTIGALLRREGLYSSHLTTWRKQREAGRLSALLPKKRGRKSKPVNPLSSKVKELEGENRRLQKQLEKAETIIAFQKKLSEILGIPMKQEIIGE